MVHGDAFAGGCELALHCDLRVAAEAARFAMPLARLGIVVPFPLGQKLLEIVGPAAAREILLTARPFDARRALEIGMVHRVVTAAAVEDATYEMARAIAANAPLSLAGMKAMIQQAISARERIEHADIDALVTRARKSADAREGVRAMLEKRRPQFRGE
jgi:enoyl-CoA hydratase/carnithine racemase